MGLTNSLPDVITEILSYEGVVLEHRDDGSLEFLLPPSLSHTLGVPEHGILSFYSHSFSEGVIPASYESEIFKAIEKLFPGKGKIARAVYPFHLPNIERLSNWISERVAFVNATFRVQKVENQEMAYVLIFFRYVALSDEKREGVFSLLVNKRNLSTSLLNDNLDELLMGMKESDPVVAATGQETIKAIQAGLSAASFVVKEGFAPFVKSLEKRLNRDTTRVFNYYETLKGETQRILGKKRVSGKDSDDGTGTPDEAGKILLRKLDAIEGEKRWKIQDLVSKYAIDVRIEPVCVIDVETETPVFWIEIRRRLSSRSFPLTYNPILRKMDPLPCEACFYPRGGAYICDEKLHILCAACFSKCPVCGKPYCSACSKSGCPRCRKKKA
jgi:hypothetical protein